MLQRLVLCCLCLCLVFAAGGWVTLGMVLQARARWMALSQHNRKHIGERHVFKFSGTASDPIVRWHHDREFSYNGWMYDVDEVITRDGIRIVIAHRDHRETEVLRTVKRTSGQHHPLLPFQILVDQMKILQAVTHNPLVDWHISSHRIPTIQDRACHPCDGYVNCESPPPDMIV